MAKTKLKVQKETPLMTQFNGIKAKHPDALLLFRVGDFYETFGEDAIKASKILGIVLTNRSNGSSKIELAGFPHHSIDTYLPKLVRAGERVAICDQLEDPKKTKKIVKRGVTELVTPGVSYRDTLSDQKRNNFLASVFFGPENIGVSFLDNSTGEFLLTEGKTDYIDKLLQSFSPSEIIYQKGKRKEFEKKFGDRFFTHTLDDWIFTGDYAKELLLKQFNTSSLKGFGIEKFSSGTISAGAVLHYLKETHHHLTQHISTISRIEQDKYVWMDRFTIRNLELFYSPNDQAKTLIDILDHTISPMGSRMIKRWVALPLKEKSEIEKRLNVVHHIIKEEGFRQVIEENIKPIGDLERLISKVSTTRISPRECNQIMLSLNSIAPIKEICSHADNNQLQIIGEQLNPCKNISEKIENTITENPPVVLHKGNVIKEGVSLELDELRNLSKSGKDYLQQILERETERTGIPSLKISFNNVFGYYLEVRNIHKDKVPEEWIRKQTLVSAERYITEELKEYESKILSAESKITELEAKLYHELVSSLSEYLHPIQINAQLISQLDCLYSFAIIAKTNNYNKANITDGTNILIKKGRHPVIEQQLKSGESYIPNDVQLDRENQQIMMITGPNMSGKSALLRQTALIILMAQIGSFVPAEAAEIGIVDKIFTRVGASDNISMGESTFMVEMNETASILNNISERSLILLDEIGRGTSTYDGVSIAWAIAEYLHENTCKAKTLFATHYHELNDMTNTFERIKNFNVSVKEMGKRILFIRTLKEGGSEHSFGIHVAKMAGMPKKIIKKSEQILKKLEKSRTKEGEKDIINHKEDMQLSFFQLDDPTLIQIQEEIAGIDINTLTPVEALMKLNEIKKLIGK
ncbi:MAG: DNA mismatch repair protein MutS [Flavobacteriales bacterium]|nr:DNA mismatch repair protein MutS [Flavobacteriales bacterium]